MSVTDLPPGIDADAVTGWLSARVPSLAPPLAFSLIAGGHSNLTYEVTDAAGGHWVLRRPPLGHVLATAHDMGREHRIISALQVLARAFALAEPEDYVRLFVDEGSPMADLLLAAEQEGIAPRYVGRLLGALGVDTEDGEDHAPPTQRKVAARQVPLLEPLSEREREVLRLLATELSGPEIADTLYVSLNTLRTHTKNIYGKLGVTSRLAAIRRAEELGLL